METVNKYLGKVGKLVYRMCYKVNFKNENIQFEDYPSLKNLGTWLNHNENSWKVIINNDSEYEDKEKFKKEFLNLTNLSESDIEIEKDSTPFSFGSF